MISLYFNKVEETIPLLFNWLSILLIAFTVSIDSFSVGIALGISKESIISASTIISLTSAIATFSGLYLGNYLNKIHQERAKYLGIILLLVLILKYIFIPSWHKNTKLNSELLTKKINFFMINLGDNSVSKF